MIFGADVARSTTFPSHAGVVATWHPKNGHYLTSTRIQNSSPAIS